MTLIAGLTGRAAVPVRGNQSRSLLSVFPPPWSSAAGGTAVLPAMVRTTNVAPQPRGGAIRRMIDAGRRTAAVGDNALCEWGVRSS
jgi:hypothetical protein